MWRKIVSALIVLSVFVSCKSSVTESSSPKIQFQKIAEEGISVQFESITIEKDVTGGTVLDGQNIVIRNREDFVAMWNKLYSGRAPVPVTPGVNFDSLMVVGVFSETQPHGGYTIEITKVAYSGDQLAVKVNKTKPGKDCVTTQALNSPFHLVKIPKKDAKVEFYEVEEVENCTE